MPKYTRRVHFFHIVQYKKEGTSFQAEPDVRGSDDFAAVCSTIFALDASDKAHDVSDDESYRLVYFNRHTDGLYRGKVAKYRTNHMLKGHISDDELLDHALDEGDKFVEVSHFVYSPKKHVLSFEYNQTGPRITAFTRYINAIRNKQEADVDESFVAEHIPHPDVIARLKDVKRIPQIAFSISADRIPSNLTEGNLLRGMDYIRGFANAGMITVQLSAGTLARGESIIAPHKLMTALEHEGIDLGILGSASVKAVTDFGDETINLIDNKMVGVKEWNSPITTKNYERWFEDITAMYVSRNDEIKKSLRQNEDATS